MVKHIGIILDGNRRYATKLLKEPWKGHQQGAEKVEELFDWCKDLDVSELTLYIFSMQNFKRDTKEVEYLMDLFCKFFSSEKIKDKIKVIKNSNRGKIIIIGKKKNKKH